MVIQSDLDWQAQTGAPDEVNPGNIPGGARDVIRGADFDGGGQGQGFAADTGTFLVSGGRLQISPDQLGGDAASVFYVDEVLPSYFEIAATINAVKPTGGYKSNAYLIFDYQGPNDFKFAGLDISTDKLVMGHRTAEGWIIDQQTPARLKPDRDYNVLLALNGTVATLVVNNSEVFSHVYAPRVDAYGISHGLNGGMVGLGAENSSAAIDNVRVQVLPPEITLSETETFDAEPARITPITGDWSIASGTLTGVPGAAPALAGIDLEVRAPYLLRIQAELSTSTQAGFFFDRYGEHSYKFAVLSVATNEVLIGHYTERSGVVIDASVPFALAQNQVHQLEITLKDTTISVVVDGSTVLGYAFNANVVDGEFGIYARDGPADFDEVTYMTDDRLYEAGDTGGGPDNLLFAGSAGSDAGITPLDDTSLVFAGVRQQAVDLWTDFATGAGLLDVLNSITVQVVDLADRALAQSDTGGATISLDPTAAGQDWFVDATPTANEEFDSNLLAIVAGAADGLIDLLTVLIHEIGHVLGFTHGSQLLVMGPTLDLGQRVLLDDLVTIDLSGAADTATIAVQVNGDGTVDIANSGVADGTAIAGVGLIVGNPNSTITLTGPNARTDWELYGSNNGSLAVDGLVTIAWSDVDSFVGGADIDDFRLGASYAGAVTFNGGGGNDQLVTETSALGSRSVAFDGGAGTADTIVNASGNPGGVSTTNVETDIARPLLFVPGFGGTFADTSLADDPTLDGNGPLEEWLLNRGIDPTRLVLEPLMEAYSDIVRTFDNIGYVDGTNNDAVDGTMYVVLWDYRVPVAFSDASPNQDGVLDDVTLSSLMDATFDTALDYLSYFMEKAVDAWTALTGAAPDGVDMVTHSTGGLVAKSYIQSAAYTEDHGLVPGSEHLLPIHTLVQTGVPNQGTGAPFAFLNNDFSLKSATRLMAKILRDAWELHTAANGLTIHNPDPSDPFNPADEVEFVGQYIETFRDLMATYDFFDDTGDGLYRALNGTDGLFNDLLAELNADNLDDFVARGELEIVADQLIPELSIADQAPGGDGDGIVTEAELLALYDADASTTLELSELHDVGVFVLDAADTGDDDGGAPDGIVSYEELLRRFDRQTWIVYSDQVDTPDLAIRQTGPVLSAGLSNELLRFQENTLVGRFPGSTEVWYELVDNPGGGDGTVAAVSSSTGFVDARLVEVSSLAGEAVEHTGITHNEISQREILRLLGVTDQTVATVSTGLLLSTAETGLRLIELGIVDPAELAAELYEETSEKVDQTKQTADAKLNQPLPIVGQSVNDLVDARLPSLGLGNFFDNLSSAVSLPTVGTPQERLDSLEADIESALGLTTDQLSITQAADVSSTGVLTLAFDLSRTASDTFDLDFSSLGPLSSSVVPVTLSGGFTLQFNVSLNVGRLMAFAGEDPGIEALTFELIDFNVFADLDAAGVNVDFEYDGIGTLSIDNGQVHVRGEMDVALNDPKDVRSNVDPPALDADQIISFADLVTAGDTPASLLAIDTSDSLFVVDLPITVSTDNPLVDFAGSGDLLLSVLDVFDGLDPDIGIDLGSLAQPASISVDDFLSFEGQISIEHRTADLALSDGTVRTAAEFDLISAESISAFIGINQGEPDAIGVSIADLDFTLLRFDDAGTQYTALTTTAGAGSLVGSGLSLDMTTLSANLNRTSDGANPDLVLDLNPGGSVAAGSEVVPTVGPTLSFDGDSGALFDVAGTGSADAFG
ncbi:MAG: hypothetical protein PVH91_10035, partial [Pseudomonadales bacterium]